MFFIFCLGAINRTQALWRITRRNVSLTSSEMPNTAERRVWVGLKQFNCWFCLFLREHEGHYLITVQLQIHISLVCVQTDVALLLHVLVAHRVVCNGICGITNKKPLAQFLFFNDNKNWNYRTSKHCGLRCCAKKKEKKKVAFLWQQFICASQFHFSACFSGCELYWIFTINLWGRSLLQVT